MIFLCFHICKNTVRCSYRPSIISNHDLSGKWLLSISLDWFKGRKNRQTGPILCKKKGLWNKSFTPSAMNLQRSRAATPSTSISSDGAFRQQAKEPSHRAREWGSQTAYSPVCRHFCIALAWPQKNNRRTWLSHVTRKGVAKLKSKMVGKRPCALKLGQG